QGFVWAVCLDGNTARPGNDLGQEFVVCWVNVVVQVLQGHDFGTDHDHVVAVWILFRQPVVTNGAIGAGAVLHNDVHTEFVFEVRRQGASGEISRAARFPWDYQADVLAWEIPIGIITGTGCTTGE